MFSLATLNVGGVPTPAIGLDGHYWSLPEIAPTLLLPNPARGLMNVFENWAQAEGVLIDLEQSLREGSNATGLLADPLSAADFLTPLQYPNKLILAGANYTDHMRIDAGRENFSKEDNDTVFFMKPPTTALVGGGPVAQYPSGCQRFDYEIELAAVIGKRARHVTVENALEHVAGYTIAVDLSARDFQRNPRHLANFDLFFGKCFDSSCPLGPGIVPARYVDHANLQLRLWVNGELRQDSNTKHMIWSLKEQLASITRHVTLEPGDVVSTGTPAGTGLLDKRFLKVGDQIDAEIPPLGKLSVEVISDE